MSERNKHARGAFACNIEQPISARFDSYFARSRFLLSLPLPPPPIFSPRTAKTRSGDEINDNSFRVVARRIIVIYSQSTLNGYINVLHILDRKVLQNEISYSRSVAPIRLYYESIDARGEEENESENSGRRTYPKINVLKKCFHNIQTAHEIQLCEWLHLMHLIQLVQQDDHTKYSVGTYY